MWIVEFQSTQPSQAVTASGITIRMVCQRKSGQKYVVRLFRESPGLWQSNGQVLIREISI